MSVHVHACMTARHPCCVNSIQQSKGRDIVKENYMNILIMIGDYHFGDFVPVNIFRLDFRGYMTIK